MPTGRSCNLATLTKGGVSWEMPEEKITMKFHKKYQMEVLKLILYISTDL